jgi:hypothetical protein
MNCTHRLVVILPSHPNPRVDVNRGDANWAAPI